MQPELNTRQSETHWPSALQFALSLLAVLLLWTGAGGMALSGLLEFLRDKATLEITTPAFMMAGVLLTVGLLVLPSAGYALRRLVKGRGAPQTGDRLRRVALLALALPAVLLVGYFAARSPMLSPLLLPPLHVLAIGLPVLWFVTAAVRGLPLGSSQRAWGVFASGLVLGPAVIIFIELLAIVVFILGGALWISTQPDLVQKLTDLLPLLSGLQDSPEQILDLLQPFLLQPPILFGVFAFVAVVVPLIEESLKPIGLWLLAVRSLTPVEGFAAGALSGAGFALFESLALATGGETWIVIVLTRIATGVLHILTAGLTGYGLVTAWREGRYAYLGLAFLTSVTIHGMWNGLAVISAVGSLPGIEETAPFGLIARLGQVAPVALVILAVLFFIGLLGSNRLLRREKG